MNALIINYSPVRCGATAEVAGIAFMKSKVYVSMIINLISARDGKVCNTSSIIPL